MTREEAIERLKQNKAAAKFYAGMVQNTNAIENELKDIEAIDMAIEALTNVQNMHKGKWIKKQVFNPELDKYVPLIECSVCGYEPYFGGSESKFNYCANCWARMEK